MIAYFEKRHGKLTIVKVYDWNREVPMNTPEGHGDYITIGMFQ